MKLKLSLLFSLVLAASSMALTTNYPVVQFSQVPEQPLVSNQDAIVLMHWTGSNYISRRMPITGLTNLLLGRNFDGLNFTNPTVLGGVLSGSTLSNASVLGGVLSGSTLTNASVLGGAFTNPVVVGGIMTNSVLEGGTLTGSLLSNPVVDGGSLAGWVTNTAANGYYVSQAARVAAAPRPYLYWMTEWGSNYWATEGLSNLTNIVEDMVTNGFVAAGQNILQLDAGWSSFNSNGIPDFNPLYFPDGAKPFINWCHSLGVRISVYLSATAPAPAYSATWGASCWGIEYQTVLYLVTNYDIDGIKLDVGLNADMSADFASYERAAAAITASGHRVYFQSAVPPTVGPNGTNDMWPQYTRFLNSAYITGWMTDPYSPFTWTNQIAHWYAEVPSFGAISPGFYLTGCGWMMGANTNNLSLVQSVASLSAISCSPIMCPGLYVEPSSAVLTNQYFLDVLQDPNICGPTEVQPGVWVRKLSTGQTAVCIINDTAAAVTNTIAASALGMPSLFTALSPWSGADSYTATNKWEVPVASDSASLYIVGAGRMGPPLQWGTNSLVSIPYRYRDLTNAPTLFSTNGLQITTNYYSGLGIYDASSSTPSRTNSYIAYPLAGLADSFSCTLGQWQIYSIGPVDQGTVEFRTNGVVALVTNVPPNVEIPVSFSVAGADTLSIATSHTNLTDGIGFAIADPVVVTHNAHSPL